MCKGKWYTQKYNCKYNLYQIRLNVLLNSKILVLIKKRQMFVSHSCIKTWNHGIDHRYPVSYNELLADINNIATIVFFIEWIRED